jgi:hypothetical protein
METIAVIPIFVNAGVAALPTIMAAAVSVVMVVFRPRELIRLLGRRHVALGVSAAVVALGLGITIWGLTSVVRAPHASGSQTRNYAFGVPSPLQARQGRMAATVHFDWAKVAQELIAQQKVRQETQAATIGSTEQASPAVGDPGPQPHNSAAGSPTKRDASRLGRAPTGETGPVGTRTLPAVERSVSVSQAERDSSCSSTATGHWARGPQRIIPRWGAPPKRDV